jgi:hypothetical protein
MSAGSTIANTDGGLAVRVVVATESPSVGVHRLIAYNNSAAITVSTSPSPVAWTGQSVPDSTFNLANDVITFAEDSEFHSVFTANLSNTSGSNTVLSVYTDAEVSFDGGSTWVRGNQSLRQDSVRGSDHNASRSWGVFWRVLGWHEIAVRDLGREWELPRNYGHCW